MVWINIKSTLCLYVMFLVVLRCSNTLLLFSFLDIDDDARNLQVYITFHTFFFLKSTILRRFVHGLWWNANYFTTDAPFQIRRRSLIQIDCSHSLNFEYFSYVLGLRVYFQWFFMIHRHDNLQIALNSRRTILCVLDAILEFETSASILFLSSSLVL